jgi:hypothetical protein
MPGTVAYIAATVETGIRVIGINAAAPRGKSESGAVVTERQPLNLHP